MAITARNLVWLLFESGTYLRAATISFSICVGTAIIYEIPAPFSSEGEDDIDPLEEIKEDEEQLEEIPSMHSMYAHRI